MKINKENKKHIQKSLPVLNTDKEQIEYMLKIYDKWYIVFRDSVKQNFIWQLKSISDINNIKDYQSIKTKIIGDILYEAKTIDLLLNSFLENLLEKSVN